MSSEFGCMSIETLTFLTDVTKMLNNSPTLEGYYLHVELRREHEHTKVGSWTDEISDKDWLFEALDADEAKP